MKSTKALLCMALLLAVGVVSAYAGGQLEKASDVLEGVGKVIRAVDETLESVGGTAGGGTGPNAAAGGTFTVTGIPSQYNGKYAVFTGTVQAGSQTIPLWGCESYTAAGMIAVRITGGSVTIPLWTAANQGEYLRFTGDGTAYGANISIVERPEVRDLSTDKIGNLYFEEVRFANGTAALPWSAGSAW